jgi:hypothetical protein
MGEPPGLARGSRSSRYEETLRLAGSLRLCDRRVQSSSCRTSFAEQRTRQSLAAAPQGLSALESHGQRPRIDEVDASSAQQPRPAPDLLGQPYSGHAVTRPAEHSRLVAAKEGPHPPATHGDEERRLDFAFARPLREQRPAVGCGGDAAPPAGPAWQASANDYPAGANPPVERRAFARGAEDGAGAEATRDVRAARNRRVRRARVRRIMACAATGGDEEPCEQNRNAHVPEYRAAA